MRTQSPVSHSVVLRTPTPITFLAADGDQLWAVLAGGELTQPDASLLQIPTGSRDGASPITAVRAPARFFGPAASAAHIYFVSNNTVVRIAKQGTGAVESLIDRQSWPFQTRVAGPHLFWSNQRTQGLAGGGPGGDPGSVMRAALDGSRVRALSTDEARALVVDGDNVYFGSGTSLRVVSIEGGASRELAANLGQSPELALDGGWVYFTRSGGVSRVPIGGGAIEPILDGIAIATHVAAQSGTVYVAANAAALGGGRMSPAEILRLRPGASSPEVIWTADRGLAAFALGAHYLYVASRSLATNRIGSSGADATYEIARLTIS